MSEEGHTTGSEPPPNRRPISSARGRRKSISSHPPQHGERLLGQVLDSLYTFVGLMTPEGILLQANRAALRAARLAPDDVLGRPFEQTYWWSYARPVQDRLRAAIARGARGETSRYDEVIRLGPKRFTTIDFQLVPMVDEDGRVTHLVPSGIDITERLEAERGLRENEARLRAIVDSAIDGILTIDHRGTILSFNPAAERIFGYQAREVLGRPVSLLMPSPDRERHAAYLAQYRDTGVGHVIGTVRELEARRKEGTVFPIELSVSKVEDLGLFTGIVRDISERKQLRAQLLTIAEEQQRRIGQDLHDDVGQELTGVALMAEALAEALQDAASSEAGLAARIHGGLERIQRRLRALARGLVPVQVDAQGLMAALDELAASIQSLHGIECTFERDAPVPIEDNRVATQLYRITQEAIANALKHSHAAQIHIMLEEYDGIITLVVRDAGVGLPGDPGDPPGGLGWKIIRFRAESIGGTLEVGPAEGGGTRVACIIGGGHADVQRRDEDR
jgi:two-component system CheB/CheR fusion protein